MHRAEQVDRNLSRREVDRLARAAGFGPARDAGIGNDQLDRMCPIERGEPGREPLAVSYIDRRRVDRSARCAAIIRYRRNPRRVASE